ncbi:MAG: BofC C-terminal domain-containing protein [Limnochordales bacterium]|nr:BofC C-terminal domain-containing protein [Limnochordales bacterium]
MTRVHRWWVVAAACVAFAAGFLMAHATGRPTPVPPEGALEAADEPPCQPGDGRYVGLHAGKVAVFEGAPGGCHRLVEEKPIDAGDLPAFQRRELEAGIPFGDDAELFQIIEGLVGP